jgi:hypothetical protein
LWFFDKIISRMVGKKGMKGGGGPRANSGGARPGTGGKREGAGRPPNVLPSTGTPQQISPAKILTPGQKWQLAEYALQHAYEALDKLIHVMRHGQRGWLIRRGTVVWRRAASCRQLIEQGLSLLQIRGA